MFKKLRGKLKEFDIDQAYLAKKLNVSSASISNRFTGKYPWNLTHMYTIMDMIQEPYELLNEYFPKDGRDNQTLEPRLKRIKNRPEEKYRSELIEIALRILLELDGKPQHN